MKVTQRPRLLSYIVRPQRTRRMEGLAKYIAAYHAAPIDEEGDAPGKTRVLEHLEGELGDPKVLAFFLSILGDPTEDRLARWHLLKWFECDPAPDADTHRRIGECIAAALRAEAALPPDERWMIKAWLGRVIGIYHDLPAAREVSAERVQDRQEIPEVRLGCFFGLRYAGPTEQVVGLFRQLAADMDDVGHEARRALAEWGEAEPGAAADGGGM